jgi:hypothetical protein
MYEIERNICLRKGRLYKPIIGSGSALSLVNEKNFFVFAYISIVIE